MKLFLFKIIHFRFVSLGINIFLKTSRKFNVFSTEKIICVGPSFIKERIMSNNAQTLYDLSIATLNFLEKATFVNKTLKGRR